MHAECRDPTTVALRASEAAKAQFLSEIRSMGQGRCPVDVERLLGLADVVLRAHEVFKATWAANDSIGSARL